MYQKIDAIHLANAIGRMVGVATYDMELQEFRHRHLRDALTVGQLSSKLKATEFMLPYKINKAVFIGHWHGMLPRLWKDLGIIQKAIGIEIDPFWSNFSSKVNWDWDFTSVVQDATKSLTHHCVDAQLVVNTSCEHMTWDWLKLVPSNMNILMQGTDMPAQDHINKIYELDDLKKVAWEHRRELMRSDVLPLHGAYSRYTVLLGSECD